jgi:hypothetical protein
MKKKILLILTGCLIAGILIATCVGYYDEYKKDQVYKPPTGEGVSNMWDSAIWDKSVWGE